MDAFCIHNARKMRSNFSLVYVSPCTFKCPIKITRQSSNSCDASSHRCAKLPGNTLANTVPICRPYVNLATRRRRRRPPLPPPPRLTFLSLHSWDQRKPTFRYIIRGNSVGRAVFLSKGQACRGVLPNENLPDQKYTQVNFNARLTTDIDLRFRQVKLCS